MDRSVRVSIDPTGSLVWVKSSTDLDGSKVLAESRWDFGALVSVVGLALGASNGDVGAFAVEFT